MSAQAVRLSNVDIDNALKDKDFEVLFQPIFDLGNGALARVETFVRWRHPSLGVLPPGAFISFFETQGRMSELTRYVLAEALAAYQGWRGSHAPGFSINLALSDLSDETFPSHMTVLLRDSAFPAELVTLECPMPPVDADIAATARQLQRLAETGARLAIEVRGRANDFLRTVQPFPFAEIKTGGAAILRFARTVRGPGLSAISELLELANEQNAAITAVGVEDQASLAALRGLGFSAAQGNHLAKVGALTQFMPSHVNDVRALLGLEALSSDDLAALFRTGGPKLAAAAIQPDADVQADAEPGAPQPRSTAQSEAAGEDDLVERLAARIARTEPARLEPPPPEETDLAAKAAAIARARRKSLAREKLASRNALKAKAEAGGDRPAPRDMQDRLSREFEAFVETAPQADEFEMTDDAARNKKGERAPPAPASATGESEAGTQASPAVTTIASPQPIAADSVAETAFGRAERAFGRATMSAQSSARFAPTIRVSGPKVQPQAPAELGDLQKVEHFEPEVDLARQGVEALLAEDAGTESEAADDGIPDAASNTQWMEETVAIEAETPVRRNRKSFLWRTVVPFSAFRPPTHFWPRTRLKNPSRRARK